MTEADLLQSEYTPEIKKIIGELQVLYVRNFIIYSKYSINYCKRVVRDSIKAADLFDKINLIVPDKFLWDTELLRKEIQQFEDYCYSKASDNDLDHMIGVHYEPVQSYFHIHLGNMDAKYCFEHSINVHYCDKCQVKYGVKKEGDKDF